MSVRGVMALVVVAVVAGSGVAVEAAPVVPVLRGVYDPGNGGTLQALWGYGNPNGSAVMVTLGAQNFFSPGPAFRGQVTTFAPGVVYGAFVTEFDGSTLNWTVNGGTATTAGAASLPMDPGVLVGAGAVVPFVKGVWEYGPGDYAAVFGYASGLDGATSVPMGVGNYFGPGPAFLGQPTVFLSGMHEEAFVVRFTGASLTWTVGYGGSTRSATASGNSLRLAFDPLPEPGSVGMVGVAVIGGLVRRRRGRRVA